MAINKNFVIKNGIQVNETLLVGDSVNNKVGINTSLPDYELEVIGGIGVTDVRIAGVTTALGDFLVANDSGEDGKAFSVRVSAGNSVGINTANPRFPLEVVGPLSIGYTAQYIFGDLEVSGDITSANFSSGNAQFSGITTFTDTTDNVLGDANTGSVQLDGGLGVEGNVTVGSGLSVFGNSFFVGLVTFAAGASGTIQLGDNADDSVEFQADVNSNIIPNTTSAFDLGSSSQEWRDLHLAGNAGIGSLSVSGISTFTLLTDNRIPIVGAGSTIEDDANLTFDGNSLAIGVALTVTGISTFNDNVSIASLTDNRIAIVGAGSTIEDDANLTFDGSTLAVDAIFDSNDTTESTSSTTGSAQFAGGVGIEKQLYVGAGASVGAGLTVAGDLLPEADGTRDLGSSSVEWNDLYIDGTANIDTLSADTAAIGDLTDNRVVIAGSSGELEDDANLTFDGNTFAVGTGVTIVGVSTFNDNVEITSLTDNRILIVGAGSTIEDDANLTFDGNTFAVGTGVTIVGVSTFNDNVRIASLTENRIPIVGAGNTIEDDANLTFDGSTLAVGVNLDVDGHTELDNVNVSGVSTFNDNVEITSLTENRIPIVGAGNTIEDDANLTFDGSQLVVGAALTVTGITTFTNTTENTLGDTSTGAVKIAGGLGVAGNVTVGSGLSVFGNSYFVGMVTFAAGTDGNITIGDANTDNVVFNADVNSSFIPNTDDTYDLGSSSQQWKDLYVNGLAELDFVNVSAASTFGSDLDINADVDISGNAGIGSLVVTGISTFVGLSTFNDGLIVHTGITTLATLNIGNAIGITSIVDEDNMASDSATALPTQQSVKAYVDAQVTAQDLDFQADTGGALSIDLDSETLSVLGTTNEIETAGSGNQIQIGLPNNVIVGSALTVTDVFAVGTAITASSGIITATSLDISGNAGIGSLRVSGISTFVGLSTFNDGLIVHSGISTFESRIVGAATSNVIPFYYDNVSNFPSAVTYHGAFAHAHNTGKAYFAHGGVWLELVNANTASVVGTGTEGYNVGVITATQADIGNGGLDVDGHTELDGVNVSGVTTTQTLHVGTGGTTLTVDADEASFAIGSATTTVTATLNGGAIPSIGLVIALGG